MDKKRNVGVTEAGFALSVLICALVAIGYFALLQFGGTSEATVETGPDTEPQPPVTRQDPPAKIEEQPQVLTVESPESPVRTPQQSDQSRTARRDDDPAGLELPPPAAGSNASQRR